MDKGAFSFTSLDEDLKLAPVDRRLFSTLAVIVSLIGFIEVDSFYTASFLAAFSKLAVLGLLERSCCWLAWVPEFFVNWSRKFLAGGQASVLLGIVFGMGSLINGSVKISSRVGLLVGSRTKILDIKFLAFSEIVTCSGKT